MSRALHRFYVEVVGAAALAAIGVSIWLATGSLGTAALLGGAPWLLALMEIGGAMALPDRIVRRLPRHPWPLYIGAAVTTVAAFAVSTTVGLIAALGLPALLGYTLWYTRQHVPTDSVKVGRPLPDFPLQTVDGTEVGSAALTHEPHVILFYRGEWCPFCMAQVRGIAAQYRELSERGVRVALISNRRAKETEELSQKFEAPMDFYVDGDGRAAAVLDIVQAGGTPLTFEGGTGGDTVVPTVIITRADGTVAWVHHSDDHRERPEPSLYLEVIDRERIAVARGGA